MIVSLPFHGTGKSFPRIFAQLLLFADGLISPASVIAGSESRKTRSDINLTSPRKTDQRLDANFTKRERERSSLSLLSNFRYVEATIPHFDGDRIVKYRVGRVSAIHKFHFKAE